MLHIGNHLSSSKGYLAMGKEALDLQADVFAFFTRNPRGGRAKDIDDADLTAFLALKKEHGIGTLKRRWLAHARTPEQITLMRTLKTAMDPKNILNPGKVI